MTGNIIVSTCCLGDMAVNAPSSSGCALGHGGRLQPYHPRKHELTITNKKNVPSVLSIFSEFSASQHLVTAKSLWDWNSVCSGLGGG